MKKIGLSFLVAASFVFIGCAGVPKGSHSEVTKLSKSPSEYNSISVKATTNLGEAKGHIGRIEAAVGKELKKAYAKTKVTKGTSGDLQIKIKITDYKKIGKFARFFAGTMAGADRLGVEVEIVDTSSKQTIGKIKATAENETARFWADGLEPVVGELSKEIVKYFRAI